MRARAADSTGGQGLGGFGGGEAALEFVGGNQNAHGKL